MFVAPKAVPRCCVPVWPVELSGMSLVLYPRLSSVFYVRSVMINTLDPFSVQWLLVGPRADNRC